MDTTLFVCLAAPICQPFSRLPRKRGRSNPSRAARRFQSASRAYDAQEQVQTLVFACQPDKFPSRRIPPPNSRDGAAGAFKPRDPTIGLPRHNNDLGFRLGTPPRWPAPGPTRALGSLDGCELDDVSIFVTRRIERHIEHEDRDTRRLGR